MSKNTNNIDYDAILSGLGFDPIEFEVLDNISSSNFPFKKFSKTNLIF